MSFVTCLTMPNQAIGRTEKFEFFADTSHKLNGTLKTKGKLKSTDLSINFKKCCFK